MRFLKPHIQRAYRLDSEFSAARSFSAGLLTALNAISKGVILIGPKLQVIAMNQVAEQILAANNGLRAERNGLRTESNTESTRLEKLISEAIATSHGNGLDAAGSTRISRRDLPPLHVLVSPVRGIDFGPRRRVCAVVFINE